MIDNITDKSSQQRSTEEILKEFEEYHEMRMRTDPGYFVDQMDRITPGGCYLCPGSWFYEGKRFGPDVIGLEESYQDEN